MSLKVIVDKKFDLNDDVPGKIEQAIGLGWKNFSILPNGEVVNADIHMKVTLGKIKCSTNVLLTYAKEFVLICDINDNQNSKGHFLLIFGLMCS